MVSNLQVGNPGKVERNQGPPWTLRAEPPGKQDENIIFSDEGELPGQEAPT